MKYTITILTLFLSLTIFAQENKKCYTTELINKELIDNKNYQNQINQVHKENKNWILENRNNKEVITIPIVVHVIYRQTHANIGIGTNIPNFQIEDQIRILNEDYSKTNSEFPNPPRNTFVNYAGNPNIKFCLATTDPNGNPTTGVTRTQSTKNSFNYNTESNDMKRDNTGGKDGWNPSEYLNIWVCDIASSGNTSVLGYAYLPGLQSWNAWKDGLVVDFQHFGTVGNSSSTSDGRTPTHEIGHYLGLYHTFCEASGGGCCDNDNTWGSNVYDTPATDDVYYGNVNANTNNNTCNDLLYGFNADLLDMDENYMAYSGDTWMFTTDQVNEMTATMNGYRSSLKNSNVSVNCTGLVANNNIDNKFNIFPNPVRNSLSIETNFSNYSIRITDILGNNIYSIKNVSYNKTIDVSGIKNGTYLIELTTNSEKKVNKIIICD
tara:strand:+ start:1871 stop:3178 length:1308 start_codon:yes stop_codon:yes gene_type:complete